MLVKWTSRRGLRQLSNPQTSNGLTSACSSIEAQQLGHADRCAQPALVSEVLHHPDADKLVELYSAINEVSSCIRSVWAGGPSLIGVSNHRLCSVVILRRTEVLPCSPLTASDCCCPCLSGLLGPTRTSLWDVTNAFRIALSGQCQSAATSMPKRRLADDEFHRPPRPVDWAYRRVVAAGAQGRRHGLQPGEHEARKH